MESQDNIYCQIKLSRGFMIKGIDCNLLILYIVATYFIFIFWFYPLLKNEIAMKTLAAAVITLFILCSFETQAQTKPPKLNQVELYKQFVGNWQAEIGLDSLEVRECREYGSAFVIEVSRVIKGQKLPFYINNISFDSNDSKFKGFLLYPNGGYFTWIGNFSNKNAFSGKIVFNFMPDVAWSEFQADFISPTEFTCTNFNQEGNQTLLMKFTKIE